MSFLWLGIGSLMLFMAAGDRPMTLAAWIAPVFLLRFMAAGSTLKRFLVAVPVLSAALALGYGEMSAAPPGALVVSIVISAVLEMALYAIHVWLRRRLSGLPATLVLPSAAVALVWVQSLGAMGATGAASYIPRDSLMLLQLASVAGLWGFVFLPYWAAAVINGIWQEGLAEPGSRRAAVALGLVAVAVYGYGAFRLTRDPAAGGTIRVAGITPGVASRRLLEEAYTPFFQGRKPTAEEIGLVRERGREVGRELLELSEEQARGGASVVVWSEASVALFPEDDREILEEARKLALERGITLGVATAAVDPDLEARMAAGEPFIRNKLTLILPDGTVAWEYLKSRLVPFMPEAANTVPGDGALRTAETPGGVVSGAICYDLDFPGLIRPAARRGAGLFVAPSNDWEQIKNLHASMARVRAVENGFALLRPASGGISIATDPYGRIVGRSDWFRDGGRPLVAEVPPGPVGTLYSVTGDLLAWLCVAALSALTVAGLVRGRRDRD